MGSLRPVYGIWLRMCLLDHLKFSSSFSSEVLHHFKTESEQLLVLFVMKDKTRGEGGLVLSR